MSYEFAVTERLRRVIRIARPEDADEWLARLPQRVARYCREWQLEPVGVPSSGAMSCCVFCKSSTGAVVLKIPTDSESGLREAGLLTAWAAGGAAPRVLAVDPIEGAFVMERLVPGTAFEPVREETDTQRMCRLTESVHCVTPDPAWRLPSIGERVQMRVDWADQRFTKTHNAQGAQLLEGAKALWKTLAHHQRGAQVLHADLQPKNILLGGRNLFVVDPLGAVGDPVTDHALWAAVQDCDIPISRRVDELSRYAGHPRDEIASWTAVFSVLELRPYAPQYTRRMAEFLCGEGAQLLGLGDTHALVDGAMSVTLSI